MAENASPRGSYFDDFAPFSRNAETHFFDAAFIEQLLSGVGQGLPSGQLKWPIVVRGEPSDRLVPRSVALHMALDAAALSYVRERAFQDEPTRAMRVQRFKRVGAAAKKLLKLMEVPHAKMEEMPVWLRHGGGLQDQADKQDLDLAQAILSVQHISGWAQQAVTDCVPKRNESSTKTGDDARYWFVYRMMLVWRELYQRTDFHSRPFRKLVICIATRLRVPPLTEIALRDRVVKIVKDWKSELELDRLADREGRSGRRARFALDSEGRRRRRKYLQLNQIRFATPASPIWEWPP